MGRSIIPILEDWYFDGNPVQTLPPFSISGEAVTPVSYTHLTLPTT